MSEEMKAGGAERLFLFFCYNKLTRRAWQRLLEQKNFGYKVLRLFTNYAEKSAMYSQVKKTGKFSGKLKTAEGKRRRR